MVPSEYDHFWGYRLPLREARSLSEVEAFFQACRELGRLPRL